MIKLGGVARHAIAAPVLAPTLTGWVVFATNLDAHEMASLQRLSAIPIEASVYQRDTRGVWIDAGNLKPSEPGITKFIDTATGNRRPGEVTTTAGTAIALVKPLPGLMGSPSSVLLIRYPLDGALASYPPAPARDRADRLARAAGDGASRRGGWRNRSPGR
ncbi:MAG: hypothetical protein WDN44_02055 [Sphingomonas sp.]